MSLNANELEGHKVVFALAQKPRAISIGNSTKIATLCPLMKYESGESISATPENFPSNGYVRWYRVPHGDWQDGDLIISSFNRVNDDNFRAPGKEWYQVVGEPTESTNGRVFELVGLGCSLKELRSKLRSAFQTKRLLRSDIYLQCQDAIAGPFKMTSDKSSTGHKIRFQPSDNVDGRVDVYDLPEFNELVTVVDQAVRLSSTDQPPNHDPGGTYEARFRIFRHKDLIDNEFSSHREMYIIPDDLLVTKACKQIQHGKSWKKLRDELKLLVELLHNESSGVSESVREGLPFLLKESELNDEHAAALVKAVVDSEAFASRVEEKVEEEVREQVNQRKEHIEATAKELARKTQTEAGQLNEEINQLEARRRNLGGELEELRAKVDGEHERAEKILENVRTRLQGNRDELIGDIALLAPLFASVGSNGSHFSAKSKANEAISPEPGELSEEQFVKNRLPVTLARHGCSISPRQAEFLHIVMTAAKLVELPHVGWAVGYAKAMGGTASVSVVSAAPDWLTFEQIFDRFIADEWRSAVDDSSRLHLIVFEGIDRCATHAWLRPWLNVIAGWAATLPDQNRSTWPDHMRLCLTKERSEACFDVPKAIDDWVLAFNPSAPAEANQPNDMPGHFPLHRWNLGDLNECEEEFDGLIKSLEIPGDSPCFPMRVQLARRLRQAIVRMNSEDADRCEKIIGQRLFACWSEGESKK